MGNSWYGQDEAAIGFMLSFLRSSMDAVLSISDFSLPSRFATGFHRDSLRFHCYSKALCVMYGFPVRTFLLAADLFCNVLVVIASHACLRKHFGATMVSWTGQ
jgi:hypothetical protein